MGNVFVGHDWAETHHDIHVCDAVGTELTRVRLAEGVEGVRAFHELVAGLVAEPGEVTIASETDRGLFIGALVGAGYDVIAINPMATARYRERYSNSGAKSDPGDAKVLADLARTDGHLHRRVAGDSDRAEAVKVLARAHQGLIWTRQRQTNQLRSNLREYYPAALEAFDELSSADALAVLGVAPTPGLGRRISRPKIEAALRRGGRQRNLERRSAEIHAALRVEHLETTPALAEAMGASTAAMVGVLVAINTQVAGLEAELAAGFEQHPDAVVILSLPGLGMVLGARVLGEFGDDPNRYADAKSRRNYAGTSPVTRASGARRAVIARHVRNRRLGDACLRWAFLATQNSPGARAFYDEHRSRGDNHTKALRALANKLVGILHGCLTSHSLYDETIAWAHRRDIAA